MQKNAVLSIYTYKMRIPQVSLCVAAKAFWGQKLHLGSLQSTGMKINDGEKGIARHQNNLLQSGFGMLGHIYVQFINMRVHWQLTGAC